MVNSMIIFAGKSNDFFEHRNFHGGFMNEIYIYCHLKPWPKSLLKLLMLNAPRICNLVLFTGLIWNCFFVQKNQTQFFTANFLTLQT